MANVDRKSKTVYTAQYTTTRCLLQEERGRNDYCPAHTAWLIVCKGSLHQGGEAISHSALSIRCVVSARAQCEGNKKDVE